MFKVQRSRHVRQFEELERSQGVDPEFIEKIRVLICQLVLGYADSNWSKLTPGDQLKVRKFLCRNLNKSEGVLLDYLKKDHDILKEKNLEEDK